MLNICNRRELCITSSMRAASEVRAILKENCIEYMVKTDDRALAHSLLEPNRIPFGRQHSLYTVYVHRKDIAQAQYLIRTISFRDEEGE